MANKPDSEHVVATNRKARHEYEILDSMEAGLVLVGTEVKALREGRCNLTGSYAVIEDGEAWLKGVEIAQYSHAHLQNHEPKRKRKLLLKSHELQRLEIPLLQKGTTLVPMRLYFKEGRAKVELALVRGRKAHDRREAIAKREAQRDIARVQGRRMKGRE